MYNSFLHLYVMNVNTSNIIVRLYNFCLLVVFKNVKNKRIIHALKKEEFFLPNKFNQVFCVCNSTLFQPTCHWNFHIFQGRNMDLTVSRRPLSTKSSFYHKIFHVGILLDILALRQDDSEHLVFRYQCHPIQYPS
jgi:hypothetical protein